MQSSMLSSVAPASKATNAKDADAIRIDGGNSSAAEETFEDILAEEKLASTDADKNSAQTNEREGTSETVLSGKEGGVPVEQDVDEADVIVQSETGRVRNSDTEILTGTVTTGLTFSQKSYEAPVSTVSAGASGQRPVSSDAPAELNKLVLPRETSGRSDMGLPASAVPLSASEPGMKPELIEKARMPGSSVMPDTPEAGLISGMGTREVSPGQSVLPQVPIIAQKGTGLAGAPKISAGAAPVDVETDEPMARLGVEVRIQEAVTPAPVRTALHPLQSVLQAQMPEQFRLNNKGHSIGSVDEVGFGREVLTAGDAFAEPRATGFQAVMAGQRVDGQMTVPRQIGDAIRSTSPGDKIIEVTLTPSELGRVRMVMTPSEAGITINVTAERPETLELMRRNINDLHQSFAEMGYEDINFSFGQDQTDTQDTSDENTRQDAPSRQLMSATPLSEPAVVQALSFKTTGIDIRV